MIAIKRLQSIMWILVVAMGALSAYLISLRVATERNDLHRMEQRIYATRANIRYLEVEFSARATMAQLEAWNQRAIRFSVPRAGQYLTSERQLAALYRPEPVETPFAAPPAMAMAQADAQPAMAPPVRSDDQTLVQAVPMRVAAAAEPVRARPAVVVAMAAPVGPSATVKIPGTVNLVDKASPSQRRAMRLALLDETLLGASELSAAARRGGEAGTAAKAAR